VSQLIISLVTPTGRGDRLTRRRRDLFDPVRKREEVIRDPREVVSDRCI
jgi:hypothetical protein